MERNLERNAEIERLYRDGLTGAKIAVQFGISPSRVQKILACRGVSEKDGGIIVRYGKKKAARMEGLDSKFMRLFGFSFDEHNRINRENLHMGWRPVVIYTRQRRMAAKRGIAWGYTFSTWWKQWEESGKWKQRGKLKDQYVMARHGDIGPYSPENVTIKTFSENCREKKSDTTAARKARAQKRLEKSIKT